MSTESGNNGKSYSGNNVGISYTPSGSRYQDPLTESGIRVLAIEGVRISQPHDQGEYFVDGATVITNLGSIKVHQSLQVLAKSDGIYGRVDLPEETLEKMDVRRDFSYEDLFFREETVDPKEIKGLVRDHETLCCRKVQGELSRVEQERLTEIVGKLGRADQELVRDYSMMFS